MSMFEYRDKWLCSERVSFRLTGAEKAKYGRLCTGPGRIFRNWSTMMVRALAVLFDKYAAEAEQKGLFHETQVQAPEGAGGNGPVVVASGAPPVLGVGGRSPASGARTPSDRRAPVKSGRSKPAKKGKTK